MWQKEPCNAVVITCDELLTSGCDHMLLPLIQCVWGYLCLSTMYRRARDSPACKHWSRGLGSHFLSSSAASWPSLIVILRVLILIIVVCWCKHSDFPLSTYLIEFVKKMPS